MSDTNANEKIHGVVAYYDVLTNRVVICEESELWKVKPELAMRQAISTIAHEGAHQILVCYLGRTGRL